MVARLANFGIAKLFDGEDMILTKTLATIGYAAPRDKLFYGKIVFIFCISPNMDQKGKCPRRGMYMATGLCCWKYGGNEVEGMSERSITRRCNK
ncbi:hypothetical protein ACS0TY_003100 [Phlomoides rotata]